MTDVARSWALAGACTAFVAIPNLGALFGAGEQTERYDTAVTPPDYAFAVWAPIFAGCVASTVGQCRDGGRHGPTARLVGWPLAGAYLVNAAWSLAAQTGRFAATPYLLPVAAGLAGVAHRRLQDAPPEPGLLAVTPVSTGLLLGWTTLASAVNVVAARADRDRPAVVTAATGGLLAVAAVVSAVVARSRRGGPAVALASAWGLGTLAGSRRRAATVRTAAALGVTAIVAAAGRRRGRAPAV
ncbi:hypothetical protein [Actinoplanes sp. G11-F43]|uniref:hypothetical protein n=1 Tax=Actinoplanes sp. G11-F43 TaxID=3424130 RepID=UPI003D3267B3